MRSAQAAPEHVLSRVARAIDALRAAETVLIRDPGGQSFAAAAVETVAPASLARFETSRAVEPRLVLTHERARTLKIHVYTPEVVALPLVPPLDPERLRLIADPTTDLSEPLKGPFAPVRAPLPDTYAAAVKLAKLAGLLPAAIVGDAEAAASGAAAVFASDVRDYDSAAVASLKLVTRARVPLAASEEAEVVAFRAGNGEPEHLAIVIGNPPHAAPVLARIHSECFTGDLLGSLRCDCGTQLREALAAIDLDAIDLVGYGFLIETTYQCYLNGLRIVEIPIVFIDRREGKSKMTSTIVSEALGYVFRRRWQRVRKQLVRRRNAES